MSAGGAKERLAAGQSDDNLKAMATRPDKGIEFWGFL
jgi:hypothetical protein